MKSHSHRVGIRTCSDYSPFGVELDGRTVSNYRYRFGYQGSEKDDEVQGNGHSYPTEFRQLDPRLGRWLSVDPVIQPWQSAYCSMDCNPSFLTDILGTTVNGDYYNKNGTWLGTDNKNDGYVYYANSVVKNKNGIIISSKDKIKLKVTHSQFRKMAATIYSESSAYKANKLTEELKKEMFGIASVHYYYPEHHAYGANSPKANEYLNMDPESINNNKFKKTANAAIINAQIDGTDYSNHASNWDGRDQALTSIDNHDKSVMINRKSIELHMNTMGWTMSDEHYEQWKKAVGDDFKAPKRKMARVGDNQGKIKFKSTAVYGETVFWKEGDYYEPKAKKEK